jgi:hypothetical protein
MSDENTDAIPMTLNDYKSQPGNNVNLFKNKKHQRNYSSNNYPSSTNYSSQPEELHLPASTLTKYVHLNINNLPIKGIFNEDSLFEHFRNKGLIDNNLEFKISEYRTNLSTNSNNKNQEPCTQNLSLKIELNALKGSLESANKQFYNLQTVLNMKKKKLEILEDAMTKIKQKKNLLKVTNEVNFDEEVKENNFKRKGKTKSVNFDEKMVNDLVNSDLVNCHLVKNEVINTDINAKVSLTTQIENLKKENEKINKTYMEEIKSCTEALTKRNNFEIKNEKIKFEEKLRELNSDNMMLTNSLQNEREFHINKLIV